MPGYDPARYPDPPWVWRPDPNFGVSGGYYELRGSSGGEGPHNPGRRHSYECVQYTLGKIQGRPPRQTDITDVDVLTQELKRLGYHEQPCAGCGCDPGQCQDCVVIYSNNIGRYHAAVFDRQSCDWGGKATGRHPIVRFKDAGDFARQGETWVCYCRNPAGPYISDVEMNRRALPEFVDRLLRRIGRFSRFWSELFRRLLGG
jgi:hypothetical protein